MKINSIEQYEIIDTILELNKDFYKSDLEKSFTSNYKLQELTQLALKRIANRLGYDSWYWMGNYDPIFETIEVKFKKLVKVVKTNGEN